MNRVLQIVLKTAFTFSAIAILFSIFVFYILQDYIRMTTGSCTVMFSYMGSNDNNRHQQASSLVDKVVRNMNGWKYDAVIDSDAYNKSLREIRDFCFEHPDLDWTNFQIFYKSKMLEVQYE